MEEQSAPSSLAALPDFSYLDINGQPAMKIGDGIYYMNGRELGAKISIADCPEADVAGMTNEARDAFVHLHLQKRGIRNSVRNGCRNVFGA